LRDSASVVSPIGFTTGTASRRKGKWTGGTVPLGFDANDKKLIVNKNEAETVRTIFRRYLGLKSFSKLVADLDRRGIVTKRRHTKVAKYNGAIPFTYGPLAYFLKNRVYLGEMHHGGKWFEGEHEAIVDRATFERVQQLLADKSNGRKAKRSDSGALLLGKLYDDKGNRMSPSFSSKNGVRYRFYVSSALLRGRKAAAGSIARVAAVEIESAVLSALEAHQHRLTGALSLSTTVAVPGALLDHGILISCMGPSSSGTPAIRP
jgi:site-specific DNA recombinase